MQPPPNLVELASRYWESAALNAAVQLNLFPPLCGQTPQSAAAVAEQCGLSPRHTTALLDALTALAILVKHEETYAVRPELIPLLDPDSPDCLLGALAFNGDLMGLWLNLPRCVREGKPAIPDNPHLGSDPDRMRRFVAGMHSRAGIMARGVVPRLSIPSGSRILDVGGGPGTFSVKLLERDASLQATVLDLPPVVQAAAELHAGNPVLSRLEFLGGDYHQTPFPDQQDVVLYSGALHQEPEAGILPLFERMRAALTPGGMLYVVDLMLKPDRTAPVYSTLFELNMMLMRPQSRVYATDRVAEILHQTGFLADLPEEVPGTPYTLFRARAS